MHHRTARRPRKATRRPRSLVRSVVAAAAGGLTFLAAAVPAFAAGTGGIDVASFQHPNGAAINWSAVKQTGVSFAFIKATEGSGYTNPWYASDYSGARAAGIYRGGYAFARPSTASGSAAAQARYYVGVNGLAHNAGDLPPMLDLEATGGLSPSQLVSWVGQWLSTVRSLTGRDAVIYVSPYFWQTSMGNSGAFHNNPLFIAEYGVSAPSVPGGWPWWTFWQSSSSGKVGGILSSVDLDQFNGDANGLARMANIGGTSAPAPTPTPTPSPTQPPSASGLPPAPAGPSHDYTGDGIPDLVVRDSNGDLWTYPGNGRGGFLPRIHTGYGGWNTVDVVMPAGDFDGDGRSDLLVREKGTGRLYLYPGKGAGQLGLRRQVGSGWGSFTCLIAPGDFDGDGHADVITRTSDGSLWLYRGDGKGGFLNHFRIGSGWNSFARISAVGDFNSDGHPDVLTRKPDGTVWLYRGNGHGYWLGATRIATGWASFTSLVGPGDFNGDGHADLVVRMGNGQLWLDLGNGRGGWIGSVQIGSGWNPFVSIG